MRKTGLVHSWVTNHRWRGNHPSTRGLRLNLARVQREKVEFFCFKPSHILYWQHTRRRSYGLTMVNFNCKVVSSTWDLFLSEKLLIHWLEHQYVIIIIVMLHLFCGGAGHSGPHAQSWWVLPEWGGGGQSETNSHQHTIQLKKPVMTYDSSVQLWLLFTRLMGS